jgi:hypothetical protein
MFESDLELVPIESNRLVLMVQPGLDRLLSLGAALLPWNLTELIQNVVAGPGDERPRKRVKVGNESLLPNAWFVLYGIHSHIRQVNLWESVGNGLVSWLHTRLDQLCISFEKLHEHSSLLILWPILWSLAHLLPICRVQLDCVPMLDSLTQLQLQLVQD